MYGGRRRLNTIINTLWDKILHIYEMLHSIEITSNSIANFAIKTGILLIIFIIIKTILKNIFRPHRQSVPARQSVPVRQSAPPAQNRYTKSTRTIEECISNEDLKFQMAKTEEEILIAIQKNKQEIKNTLRKANQTVDVSWLDSCDKILRISNTLDNNLAYYRRRNLEISKFQYYANLHFRSMVAADIVHSEYEKVDRSFKEMNNFIVRMKSNPEFRGNYKTQVHGQKDQIKLIRGSYLDRVHNMNHETEILRDKIGSECGERGKKWWIERTRYKNGMQKYR